MPTTKVRGQMAGKIEAVEGVKETLTAAEGYLAYDASFEPDQKHEERNPAKETAGSLESVPAERSGKMVYTVELAGSGVPGTPPFWGMFLKACGCSETIVTNTSVEYKPATLNHPSLTLAQYTGELIKRLWGARGDAVLTMDLQKKLRAKFTFTGCDWEEVDGGLLVGINYPLIKPQVFMGASFSFDTYAAIISKLELALSNSVQLRGSANAASGYMPPLLNPDKARQPKLTFDPEQVTVATKNFCGLWRGSAGAVLSCTIGSTPGNIITLSAPKAQITDLKNADRKGIRINQLTALLRESSGDDEWSLLLT
ncbi:MAG: hypothetical protein NTY36_01245 [Deltaproteobacteria bacterium]|nr:hypothetical protein [Deltaproteobacteria bacterium]